MILARVAGVLKRLAVSAFVGAACVPALVGTSAGGARSANVVHVVAAENVWGSIAAQLGGDRVQVTSVITNPGTDPHDYEPTAADARTLAGAQLLIETGIGYDPWAAKLAAANPVDGRIVLDVGDLVGIEPGGNPHRWYSPADVQRVIAAIVAGYRRLDPADREYHRLIASIRHRYDGVAVGASESVFAPLAQALGLKLLTPPSFLKAISEGTEPTVADKTTIDSQIARKQIKVWVYNSQNGTPDVDRITEAARKRGIPVTTITETLSPATASFQSWQVAQLKTLAAALHAATGR
jgi:zinc/manganese transport system substrate-binding protein